MIPRVDSSPLELSIRFFNSVDQVLVKNIVDYKLKKTTFMIGVYVFSSVCIDRLVLIHSCSPFQHLLSERLTCLGIMGEPWVPPLYPSETIVLRNIDL